MTKCEKYWVFGMILMLCVKHQDVPTLLGSLSNVISYIGGLICFALVLWFAIRGEK